MRVARFSVRVTKLKKMIRIINFLEDQWISGKVITLWALDNNTTSFCMTQRCITHLNSTTGTTLHKIADVSRFNARSDEWLYIVVVQFFQLHRQNANKRLYIKLEIKQCYWQSNGCRLSRNSAVDIIQFEQFSLAAYHAIQNYLFTLFFFCHI